jgi:hypothetical protein
VIESAALTALFFRLFGVEKLLSLPMRLSLPYREL